jgi:hypothetical protein
MGGFQGMWETGKKGARGFSGGKNSVFLIRYEGLPISTRFLPPGASQVRSST